MSKLKYELSDICKNGLHRIQALKDIPRHGVKVGDFGGWVQSVENLSQAGDCWVANDAVVKDSATVTDDAIMLGCATLRDSAYVTENARVLGNAQVHDSAVIFGDAIISECAQVFQDARVSGSAQISGAAYVCGSAQIGDEAKIHENAHVYGSARVYGSAAIYGNSRIGGNAHILNTKDALVIGPIGTRPNTLTFYRERGGGIGVACGSFGGTLAKFMAELPKLYEKGQEDLLEYRVAILMAEARWRDRHEGV